MKNIKNTIAAMSLMAIMGFGATAANAGIIMGDRGITPAQTVCSNDTGIMSQLEGIIIVGYSAVKTGIMLADRDGIILVDRSTPCTQNTAEGQNGDGIIIVG